jgi:uncharacterized protein (TIGR00661 family)
VTRLHYVGARAYIVLNFFQAPLKSDAAVLAPLVVRPAVTTLEQSNTGPIVIYSTTGTHEDQLREVLSKRDEQRFYIYGFNKHAEHGNCVFKERSTEGFLTDLAAARGVIASAGSSLLAECLYLRKRMLLLPLPGQYEQIINAYYAEKFGLALWSRQLDEPVLSRFLERIDEPLPEDDRILWPDNERFFAVLQGVLSNLDLPVSVTI